MQYICWGRVFPNELLPVGDMQANDIYAEIEKIGGLDQIQALEFFNPDGIWFDGRCWFNNTQEIANVGILILDNLQTAQRPFLYSLSELKEMFWYYEKGFSFTWDYWWRIHSRRIAVAYAANNIKLNVF